MEDIYQIIIIAAIIAFTIIKKLISAGEEKKKRQRPPVTLPEYDKEREEATVVKKNTKPFLSFDYDHSTPFAGTAERPAPPLIPEETDEVREFDIHSTEEVRRAIIWSEILNRKY